MIGLTGSLPPSLYPVLCELTVIKWNVIRTPSSRKELKYQVVKVKSDNVMDSAIVDHLHRAMSSYQPEDRAIVFCRSKENVKSLAALFETHPYCAPGDDENLSKKNMEAMVKWISGDPKIMTSTNILGCGIDYSHIRDVVHRDPSFSMLDQYQEDSRGGRDGSICRATTFIVENKNYTISEKGYDLGAKKLLDSLSDTTNCLRMAPTLFLDGQASQCITLPGAHFCENCERSVEFNNSALLINSSSMSIFKPVNTPPKRSLDLFDPSPGAIPTPRIDLRNHIIPLKRKRSSLDSNSSTNSRTRQSSSAKRVRFSDTPLPPYVFYQFIFILLLIFKTLGLLQSKHPIKRLFLLLFTLELYLVLGTFIRPVSKPDTIN